MSGSHKRTRARKGAPGLLDVAQRAGVSGATVSRYFNHRDVVRPDTRQRIERAARELGYIRDRAAGTLHGKMSGTVGLIVPTIDHAIFSELIEAFSNHLHAHDRTMLIASHNYDLDREVGIVRSLLERRIDAIALVGRDHSIAAIEMLKIRNIPTLTLWNAESSAGFTSIGTDHWQGGFEIARHLVDLKHRHIALLFPDTRFNDRARDRKAGAMEALVAADISVPEPWDILCSYDIDAAKQAAMALLQGKQDTGVREDPPAPVSLSQSSKSSKSSKSEALIMNGQMNGQMDEHLQKNLIDRPTAIICGNDVIAHGVIHAASRLKLAVPTHLSVVGIGDFRGSSAIEPPLTTVRLPARRIGTLAASTLVDALSSRRLASMPSATIPVKLIVRESTAVAAGKTHSALSTAADPHL